MSMKKHPYVSFCILTYKQEDFILAALQGAVNQDYDDMEIIVSDDCSPDATYEKIQSFVASYRGSKQIIVNRNEYNLGLVPHYNYVLGKLAKGEILIIADGDDVSYPNRTADTVAAFQDEKVMLVTGGHCVIDSKGEVIKEENSRTTYHVLLTSSSEYLKSKSFMCGAFAPAFRRNVIDWFGTLQDDCQTEDSTLRFRSLLLGDVVITNKLFQYYRRHDNNITSSSNLFRLKTKLIAAQYKRDLDKVYEGGLLSRPLYRKLNRKIRYYVLDRELSRLRTTTRLWGIVRRVVNWYFQITM